MSYPAHICVYIFVHVCIEERQRPPSLPCHFVVILLRYCRNFYLSFSLWENSFPYTLFCWRPRNLLKTLSECYYPVVYGRGVKLIFTWGHISLLVAFKGLNVILGLYKCNYSLTVKRELSTAARQKQGARPDKTMWRAGFGPRALCLPPGP